MAKPDAYLCTSVFMDLRRPSWLTLCSLSLTSMWSTMLAFLIVFDACCIIAPSYHARTEENATTEDELVLNQEDRPEVQHLIRQISYRCFTAIFEKTLAFPVAAARTWNSLPPEVTSSRISLTCKSKFRTCFLCHDL